MTGWKLGRESVLFPFLVIWPWQEYRACCFSTLTDRFSLQDGIVSIWPASLDISAVRVSTMKLHRSPRLIYRKSNSSDNSSLADRGRVVCTRTKPAAIVYQHIMPDAQLWPWYYQYMKGRIGFVGRQSKYRLRAWLAVYLLVLSATYV